MIAVPQTDAMFRWHQQNQEAQQNAMMGGGPAVFLNPLLRDPATGAMPSAMQPTQGGIPPVPSNSLSQAPIPSMGAMPGTIPPAPGSRMGMPRLPFGGFRANGGPVRPGMAYVVGERGPELMVPSVPGTIVPNGGSRVAQSPMNRPYAELAGGTGSLANRGVRQIGRSANDPTRIAEQMRRRGDPRAIMQLGQMQMGQNFARERDAVNFAQSQMMFGQQQQAMNERDARNFDQGLMMFGLQQQGMEARDAANFAQQQQLEAERRAAELAAQNEARNRQPNVSFQPIPGTDYGIPSADGRPMGTVPVNKPKSTSYAPVQGVPGLMVPTGPGADKLPPMQQVPNPGWSVTGQPKTRMEPVGGEKPPAMPKAPSGIQYTYDADGNVTGGFYPRFNPATGRFVISKLDLDGDGVPDAQQGGAGAGAASSSTTRQPSGFLSFLP